MDSLIPFVGHHPLLVGLLVALLVAFFLNERARGGRSLTPQEVVTLINRDSALVIDLRDTKEFQTGHIVDALNIPFSALAERLPELTAHKLRPIVLICRMGQHAGAAGTTLQKAGFAQVARLSGGMTEWQNSNLPTTKN